jgi:hypothetical protein
VTGRTAADEEPRAGLLMVGVMLSAIAFEYTQAPAFGLASGLLAAATVAVSVIRVSASRVAFVLIGLLLILWAAALRDGWLVATMTALQRGALVIALFGALAALRRAAMTSPEIIACGQFLSRQAPGRRYAALTIGGHLFALVLIYGSISLLGSLATESVANEPDAEIKSHRMRRMMVAIQRGFASTLCWSPLGFSMIVTLAVVPGAQWSAAAIPCVISALMMLFVGFALDAIFNPSLIAPPPPRPPEIGRWLVHLGPLLVLLATVMSGVAILHAVIGGEVIGAVMTVVPSVAVLWIAMQPGTDGVGQRISLFVTRELPAYRGEIVLLFMAGFIGSIGSFLLVPVMQTHGPDLSSIPPLLVLVALVWIIPLTGQIGMNPILAVSLLVPLLPSPEAMGISPVAIVVAVTGGWALSGATSPFTASVLLAASLARVSPRRAGIGWNGVYTVVMGGILSIWALLLAWTL